MDAQSSQALLCFGFLTVLESAEHGLFGGYLILSLQGRPLEFRCSTPVVATRAQEILYGPTLRPYLLADVIGASLLSGAELNVRAILTDQPDMLALALVRPEEVLLVERAGDDSPAPPLKSHDRAGQGVSLEFAGCRISASTTSLLSHGPIQAMLEPLATHVCLLEPFDRVRAALEEAQVVTAGIAEDPHDRAAA